MSSITVAKEIVSRSAKEFGVNLEAPFSEMTAPGGDVLRKIGTRVETGLDDLFNTVVPARVSVQTDGWQSLRRMVGEVEAIIEAQQFRSRRIVEGG